MPALKQPLCQAASLLTLIMSHVQSPPLIHLNRNNSKSCKTLVRQGLTQILQDFFKIKLQNCFYLLHWFHMLAFNFHYMHKTKLNIKHPYKVQRLKQLIAAECCNGLYSNKIFCIVSLTNTVSSNNKSKELVRDQSHSQFP